MMKFFVSIVMFFLFLNVFATAQTLIEDSCKKAAAKDRNIKYDFCVKSLQEDPESRTATSVEGLLVASTKIAASKMASLKGFVDNMLKSGRYKGIEIQLQDCLELYSGGNDSLNEALMKIRSHDYVSLNVNLSAALDAPETCETGFKEGQQLKSPLTNDNDVLIQKILISLAFSTMR